VMISLSSTLVAFVLFKEISLSFIKSNYPESSQYMMHDSCVVLLVRSISWQRLGMIAQKLVFTCAFLSSSLLQLDRLMLPHVQYLDHYRSPQFPRGIMIAEKERQFMISI